MKSDLDPCQIKETFALVEPVTGEAAAYFYGRLFAEDPQLRAMFPATMDVQRERFFGALARIAWSMDSPEALRDYLRRLGRDHRKFGVAPEHYASFGRALVATIRKFADEAWTAEAERAWTAAFDQVSETMIEAAAEDARTAPPWWVAEVVSHDRRTPEIAVLTVRPDKPFRYRAGQWMSVQSARSPREWRKFSIANAPREDGLLEIHVRSVPGGRVSNTLVRYTSPGDTLLLGPARGRLVADTGSDRRVLCIAEGTGLAPVKAIIEQLLAQPSAGPSPAGAQEAARQDAVHDAAAPQAAEPHAAVHQTAVCHAAGHHAVDPHAVDPNTADRHAAVPQRAVQRGAVYQAGFNEDAHAAGNQADFSDAAHVFGQRRSEPSGDPAQDAESTEEGQRPAGERRAVHVFVGASDQAGLYDLSALRELESAHPSLRVIPAVSGHPGFHGASGLLPGVVRRYGSWNGRDVYISGPARMVRDTTDALISIGMPIGSIRSEVTVTG